MSSECDVDTSGGRLNLGRAGIWSSGGTMPGAMAGNIGGVVDWKGAGRSGGGCEEGGWKAGCWKGE